MSANGGDFIILAENQGATTSSAEKEWRGGEGVSLATATFGGGTVVLEYRLPIGGGTWIPLATHSAAGPISFRAPAGRIRATTTGAAAAAYAYAAQT